MSSDLESNIHQRNLKAVRASDSRVYEFEEFRLDAAHLMLYRRESEISLPPKQVETLLALVERSGEIVSKDALMERLWQDAFVEESNLNQNIYILRKILGETSHGKPMIETLRRRGYRFNGQLKERGQPQYPAEISDEVKHQEVDMVDPARNRVIAAIGVATFLVLAIGLGYYQFSAKRAVAGNKKTIAVLPIQPINSATREEIYEIGIADSLIQRFSSMKGFVVRPLSATRKYGDIRQDPVTAGRELQVDYVLAANYQLAGGKIKVTAQLINVANGQTEETYRSEKDAGDVFAMQDAIAGEIGNKLLARFVSTASNSAAKRGTSNEEAYRLYLQGRTLSFSRTPEAARKAVEYFEQAIKLDPNFAEAYSGMAHALIASGNLGGGLPREEYEKAKQAVTKALALDNNLGEAYAVLGELRFTNEWDFAGAEKALFRAVELEPNSDLAHEQYAFYFAVRGHFDEAMAQSNIALEINPSSLVLQHKRGVILYLARRYDEAITQQKRVLEVDENHGTAWGWLWLAYEMKGDDAAAYESFMKFQKRKAPERLELYQNIYKISGWQGVLQENFELQKLDEQKPSANLYAMARQCALLGKKEQAFQYLNKAFEKHQGQMVMLSVEPAFELLRDDARYDELVRRVGLK